MLEAIQALSATPLPTIFALAGVLFLLLGLSGSIMNKVAVRNERQNVSLGLGVLFVALSAGLFLVPPPKNTLMGSPPAPEQVSDVRDPAPTPRSQGEPIAPVESSRSSMAEHENWPVIAVDAFDEAGEWSVGRITETFTAGVRNGSYRWELTGGVEGYVPGVGGPVTDFYAAVTIEILDRDHPAMGGGLRFRIGPTQEYFVRLDDPGMLGLGIRNRDGARWISNWPVKVDLDEPLRLAVAAIGSEIKVFLDGALIGVHNDETIGSGSVGLLAVVLTEGSKALFSFDDFELRGHP